MSDMDTWPKGTNAMASPVPGYSSRTDDGQASAQHSGRPTARQVRLATIVERGLDANRELLRRLAEK